MLCGPPPAAQYGTAGKRGEHGPQPHPRLEQCKSTRKQNGRLGTEAGFLCRVRVRRESPKTHKLTAEQSQLGLLRCAGELES